MLILKKIIGCFVGCFLLIQAGLATPLSMSGPDTPINTNPLPGASQTVHFTVTNHLGASLPISVIGLSGFVSQTNNCGSSLAGGSSCMIAMTIAPTSSDSGVSTTQTLKVISGGRGGNSPAYEFTIEVQLPSSITVTPANASVALGNAQQYVATANYGSTTQDVTSFATWTSSATGVASINSSGLANALTQGTSTITAAYQGISGYTGLTVVARPVVSGISTTAGPTAGGTSVTITGTHFSDATAVNFGANAATSYAVNSSTSITAVSPSGSAGTVDITVTTAGGTSATNSADQFTYAPAPTVTGLSPTSGSPSGGTSVTITGTDFSGVTAVNFGANSAAFSFNSPTSITAVSPSGSAGTVDITVTTVGGTSATSSADEFTYASAPTVTGLSPTSGSGSGGTSVTITGTDFSGVTAVKFGTTTAAYTFNSSTSITATSPAGSGTVDVRVTAAGGTSAISSADHFTYTVVLASITVTRTVGTPVLYKNLTGSNTASFTATGHYSDGSTQNLTGTATWSVAPLGTVTFSGTNPNVATAAVQGRNATITASSGGVNGTSTISVATLQSIALSMPSTSIWKNGTTFYLKKNTAEGFTGTMQLSATGTYSDGTGTFPQVITSSVVWNSADPGIASVGTLTGLVTAAGYNDTGTAITAVSVADSVTSNTLTAAVVPYFIYVGPQTSNRSVVVFPISNTNGTLLNSASAATTTQFNVNLPGNMTISSGGTYFYLAGAISGPPKTIYGYAIAGDGSLASVANTGSIFNNVSGISIASNDKLYVADNLAGSPFTTTLYYLTPSAGTPGTTKTALTLAGSGPILTSGQGIATTTILGTVYLYNSMSSTNRLAGYSLDGAGTTATWLSTANWSSEPKQIAINTQFPSGHGAALYATTSSASATYYEILETDGSQSSPSAFTTSGSFAGFATPNYAFSGIYYVYGTRASNPGYGIVQCSVNTATGALDSCAAVVNPNTIFTNQSQVLAIAIG